MAKRVRSHIPLKHKLAAALACLLPQHYRDDLRRLKVRPEAVLSHFHFDHIVLHAQGGSDEWWNLNPMTVGDHRDKSRRDTRIVAKSRRIEPQWREFMRAVEKGRKPPKRASRWPKRKMGSRK